MTLTGAAWIVIVTSSVLSVSSLLASLAAMFLAARGVRVASESQQLLETLKPYAKDGISQRLDELEDALQVVANRVKMSKVRTAANHVKGSQGEPDPRVDPEGWRNWQNRQLKTGVVN